MYDKIFKYHTPENTLEVILYTIIISMIMIRGTVNLFIYLLVIYIFVWPLLVTAYSFRGMFFDESSS